MGVQIHISPQPALHIEEKIFALWTQWVGDEVCDSTPCGIDCSSVATDFLHSTADCFFKLTAVVSNPLMQYFCFSGSVATCSGRSTRNVNMPPPRHHPTASWPLNTRTSNPCVHLQALQTISTRYTKMQHYQTSVQRSNMSRKKHKLQGTLICLPYPTPSWPPNTR